MLWYGVIQIANALDLRPTMKTLGIDEVRIWSQVRTPSQIFDNDAIPATPTSSLQHHNRCDAHESLATGFTGTNDIRDFALSHHIDTRNTSTSSCVDRGTIIDVTLQFTSGRTAFTDVDHGILTRCGAPVVAASEVAARLVATEDLTTTVVVNGGASDLIETSVSSGDQMLINFQSPGGTHDFRSGAVSIR